MQSETKWAICIAATGALLVSGAAAMAGFGSAQGGATAGGYSPGGTDVAVADGGTGSSTAAAARTALGLAIGTDIQAQNALLQSLADGTDLPVANGGTGASSESAARTALGLAIGSDIQAYSSELANIAGGGQLPIASGGTNANSAGDARTNLGLVIGTNIQAQDSDLQSIADITTLANGDILTYSESVVLNVSIGSTGDLLMVGSSGLPEWTNHSFVWLSWNASQGIAPAANFATFDSRNNHGVLDFDNGTDESTIFEGVMPNDYSGGTLVVELVWASTSETSGTVVWDVSFERIVAGGLDIDGDSFATAQQSSADTTDGTCGITTVSQINFTQAQADSVAGGEPFRLMVTRDVSEDSMACDAELMRVSVNEQ